VKESAATPSSQLNLEALQGQLDTRFFGRNSRLVYVPVVDSTNILSMQLARQGAAEGTVVLTDSQTAGKGRLGRQWLDVQYCHVLSSTILRPAFSPYLLVMMASLAVVNAISSVSQVVASIKWPNDILIGNRKVAGILIETSHDRYGRMLAIVGIGVNVNGLRDQLASNQLTSTATDLQRPGALATTLQTESGHVVNRETFIAHLLHHLESLYLGLQQEAHEPVAMVNQSTSRLIREQWRSQLSTLGRHIEVRQGNTIVSGVAEDVDETGGLLLRNHSGLQVSITWGDIGYPTE